jgi:hypothetical protein
MIVWPKIVEAGWAAEFAAGHILYHLEEGDDKKARWFWAQLNELCRGALLPCYATPDHQRYRRSGRQMALGRANAVLVELNARLTHEERQRLQAAD